MNGNTSRRGFLGTAAAGTVLAGCAGGYTQGRVKGRWTKYEIAGGEKSLPGASHLVMSVPAVDTVEGKPAYWFQMEVFASNKRLFAISLLADSLDFLYPGGPEVPVQRYILHTTGGKSLEYRSVNTTKALLPQINFFEALLPHGAGYSEQMPFFINGFYMGKPVKKIGEGKGASLLPIDSVQSIFLDDEVHIGTGRNFRDNLTDRMYMPGSTSPPGRPDYEYVRFSMEDYRSMVDTGVNLFEVDSEQVAYVIDEPVFVYLAWDSAPGFKANPDLLYRSNFLGTAMFMDEPAIITIASKGFYQSCHSPGGAANDLIDFTRGHYLGNGGYSIHNLHNQLVSAGYDLGDVVVEQGFPVWETVSSAAWYEMNAGMPGFVHEGRIQPRAFAMLMRDTLGVDFPDDVDSCHRFHHAFFRGAARRFGAKWGVAIYGQMDFDAAVRQFPLAYDQGATYFWFWTSDHEHHVPFKEQMDLTRAFREWMRSHPRQRPEVLNASAKTAIALPWGYLLDIFVIEAPFWGIGKEKRLWGSNFMKIEDRNGAGITYREALAPIATQAAELLRAGIDFDFVFNRGESFDDYETVYRFGENGSLL